MKKLIINGEDHSRWLPTNNEEWLKSQQLLFVKKPFDELQNFQLSKDILYDILLDQQELIELIKGGQEDEKIVNILENQLVQVCSQYSSFAVLDQKLKNWIIKQFGPWTDKDQWINCICGKTRLLLSKCQIAIVRTLYVVLILSFVQSQY